MRGAQTPDSKMVLLVRPALPERERMPGPLCQEEMPFFLLRMRHLVFLLGTSGSFCKFNSFLFPFFFKSN